VNERRHDGVRVKLPVRGIELIATQRHDVVVGFLALFLEGDADLLGTDRVDIVIEFQHVILPLRDYAASLPRRSLVNLAQRSVAPAQVKLYAAAISSAMNSPAPQHFASCHDLSSTKTRSSRTRGGVVQYHVEK